MRNKAPSMDFVRVFHSESNEIWHANSSYVWKKMSMFFFQAGTKVWKHVHESLPPSPSNLENGERKNSTDPNSTFTPVRRKHRDIFCTKIWGWLAKFNWILSNLKWQVTINIWKATWMKTNRCLWPFCRAEEQSALTDDEKLAVIMKQYPLMNSRESGVSTKCFRIQPELLHSPYLCIIPPH